MSPDDPASLSAAAAALASRRISSVELTEATLARAGDRGRALNAFVAIDRDGALAAARASDAAREAGHPQGPLAGIPLAHKDMFDRAGAITGCASKIRQGHVAGDTATVIARLQTAGAHAIGRLKMSELAMGPTGHNHHYGRALNPRDPERVTGGSSSGSGAAVGGGVVLAALGSDTGGSIRLPAACCGVVGFKPSQNRVSRHGAMPLSFSQDCIGPLARTVDDAHLIVTLIAGPDGRDTTVVAGAGAEQPLPDGADLRFGFATSVFSDDLAEPVGKAIDDCRGRLGRAGAACRHVPIPPCHAHGELSNILAMAEGAAVHFEALRERADDFGPQVRARLMQGLAIPAPVYLRALQQRPVLLAQFIDSVFSGCDVLVVPTMPFLPPLAADMDVQDGQAMNRMVGDMARFTRPFSYLGLPVVSLPVAWVGGLPVAVQVVARPMHDHLAVAGAKLLERLVG